MPQSVCWEGALGGAMWLFKWHMPRVVVGPLLLSAAASGPPAAGGAGLDASASAGPRVAPSPFSSPVQPVRPFSSCYLLQG